MIGRQIGQFRIRARLGQGGMGDVYLADDTALRRKVALKFVSGEADADAGRRLQHEAYAVAALDHPFICKVFEAGEREGLRYIAMEYLEGQTLKDRLAAGPLPVADVSRIARELAEALDYAHTRGIVHRDLKPANIMLTADGHIKVMDFGIAKRVLPAGADWTTQSTAPASDELTGTLAYMSPEQVRGQSVDARSDVFAYGIVLYELLTGVNPFLRDSAYSTAEAIVHDSPPPVTPRVPGTPAALASVITQCLQKNRDRRCASFRDVRTQIVAADTTRTVEPPPRARFGRRVVLATGLAALGLLIFLWWRFEWPPFPRPALAFAERDWIVIADFENLTGDKVFDQSLNAALEVAIAQSKYVNVFPRHRLQAALQRMRKPADTVVDVALASDIAQREGLRAVLACSVAQVGDVYSLAARVIDPRAQVVVIRESVDASRRAVLEALNDLAARVRRELGESMGQLSAQGTPLPLATTTSLEALKMYADSVRARDEDTGRELLRQAIALDPDFAMALASLGYRLYLGSSRESRTEGDRLFERALALSNRLTIRERLWIQAAADDARGNREQAAIGYRTYLAQYPDDSRAWFRLGWTNMAALAQFVPAIEAFEQFTRLDPGNVSGWINLASSYNGARRYERAVETYQKAFAVSPDDALGIYVNGEYGSALVHLGRQAEARDAFDRMMTAPDAVRQARGRRSMASLLMLQGRYHDAVSVLRAAVELNESNQSYLSAFRDRTFLAQAYLALGARRAAEAELDAMNRLSARLTLGPEWLSRLVLLRVRLGQLEEGRRVLALIAKAVGNTLTDTSVNRDISADQGHLDLARSAIELAAGRAEEAVALAASASPRLRPVTVLATHARALESAGRLDDAAAKYRDLIAVASFGFEEQEDAAAAHVALGGMYERQGRVADARAIYEQLVTQWKDGDPDLVLLKDAREALKRTGRE